MLLFFAAGVSVLSAQTGSDDIHQNELILKSYFEGIREASGRDEKIRHNQKVVDLLKEILKKPGSFDYPFDALVNLGKITSGDGNVRIYTWNLSFNDGSHKYYGFVQYRLKKKNFFRCFFLDDRSEEIKDPENESLSDKRWFGALYYQIVQESAGKTKYYTLLAVDLNDLFTTKKIIDVMYFTEEGDVRFGNPIFTDGNHTQHRVIFEFSSQVSMTLRYEKSLKMIVFDHLSPSDPDYLGQYVYYGPDSSNDGFKFENGNWVFMADIDVRNK